MPVMASCNGRTGMDFKVSMKVSSGSVMRYGCSSGGKARNGKDKGVFGRQVELVGRGGGMEMVVGAVG